MTGQSGSARKYPRYSIRQENGKAGVDRVCRKEPWDTWLRRTRKEARE